MKHSRIKSSHTLPLRRQLLHQRTQQLQLQTRELISRPSSAATLRNESSSGNKSMGVTCASREQGRQGSRSVAESYVYQAESSGELLPHAHAYATCRRKHSPLSIMRSRLQEAGQVGIAVYSSQSLARKKQFLRKGTGIEKAIVTNILKSKVKGRVCTPGFAYCDVAQNDEFASAFASRIPLGIRDIVGLEEMFRMSHLFTGRQYKNTAVSKCVKQAIQNRPPKLRKRSEDEQSIILRSIERW